MWQPAINEHNIKRECRHIEWCGVLWRSRIFTHQQCVDVFISWCVCVHACNHWQSVSAWKYTVMANITAEESFTLNLFPLSIAGVGDFFFSHLETNGGMNECCWVQPTENQDIRSFLFRLLVRFVFRSMMSFWGSVFSKDLSVAKV